MKEKEKREEEARRRRRRRKDIGGSGTTSERKTESDRGMEDLILALTFTKKLQIMRGFV